MTQAAQRTSYDADVRLVAEAIANWRHIPDAGDGYPATRMGSPEELAKVALDALADARRVTEPTWNDVLNAIGREFWKLAPQEFAESGHKDLVFGVCWQNLVYAVETAIDSVIGPAQP